MAEYRDLLTPSPTVSSLEASRQLLGLGLSHLILAVRSKEEGNNSRIELARDALWAKIEVGDLNMSDHESVTQFTQKCTTLPRLDFAILNTGISKYEPVINKVTGHEEVLQVNYLSAALLAIQLLPVKTRKTAPGPGRRSSPSLAPKTADWAKFKEEEQNQIFSVLNNPKYFEMQDRHYTFKLLEQIFLIELSRTLPNSRAIINPVNPGFCYGSGLHNEITTRFRARGMILTICKPMIGRSRSAGARTLVYAAVVQGPASHG